MSALTSLLPLVTGGSSAPGGGGPTSAPSSSELGGNGADFATGVTINNAPSDPNFGGVLQSLITTQESASADRVVVPSNNPANYGLANSAIGGIPTWAIIAGIVAIYLLVVRRG